MVFFKFNRKSTGLIIVGTLPPPYTGPAVDLQLLQEELKKSRIEFDVVNIVGKKGEVMVSRWLRALEYMPIMLKFIYLSIIRRNVKVYIYISQSKFGFLRDFLFIWIAWLTNHDVVAHLRGGNYHSFYYSQQSWSQPLIKTTLQKCKKIIILSERLESMFDFDPTLRSKLRVVPNGWTYNNQKNVIISKSTPNKSNVEILFLSNLIESKGYLDLLEAVNILVNEYEINAQCHFAGEFMPHPSDDVKIKNVTQARLLFETYIDQYNLNGNIHYYGVVSGEEKIDILRRSHFFVLPTNYDNEGQPMSIIEAMSFGCVVISTNYRAIPDLVINNKTGYLVPYASPIEIANAIMNGIQSPERYLAMSRAAVNHYKNQFTRESYLQRLLPILFTEE